MRTYEHILGKLQEDSTLIPKLMLLYDLKNNIKMKYPNSIIDKLYNIYLCNIEKIESYRHLNIIFIDFCERFDLCPIDVNWEDFNSYLKEHI